MKAVCAHNLTKYFSGPGHGSGRESLSPLSRLLGAVRPKRTVTAALNGVGFEVERGEIFGILGANGSGKSTLIRIISTLLLPDEGFVSVFGYDVVSRELEVRRIINRVSVEASFFKKLSAMENLMYAARLYGLDGREARERINLVTGRLGFRNGKLTEPVENLSRGMQQKVSITRALLTKPSLLLLDEPTTGLDPCSKRQVQEYVASLNREEGLSIILTTHDMDEAERLCRRVAIMKEGRIVALGTPPELKRRIDMTFEEVFLELAGGDSGSSHGEPSEE
ncbi:MAG: ABC transporter ATP-binding protein [Candidatus Eremiobacteraeota bacterium]|nr:ABC transporter ATP-binding protein [Candidatus Eremiobacteraeota bacterium]